MLIDPHFLLLCHHKEMVLAAVCDHIQKMMYHFLQAHILVSYALLHLPEQKHVLIINDVEHQLGQGGIIVSVKERLGDAHSLEDVLEGGAFRPCWDSICSPTVSKSRPTCSRSSLE